MSTPRVAYALELVALVDDLEVAGRKLTATIDPDEAAASLPALLVTPPGVDFTAHEPILTWSIQLLSSSTAGGRAVWEELDGYLDALEELLPVESATAGVYPLNPDAPAVPCFSVRLVTQGSLT